MLINLFDSNKSNKNKIDYIRKNIININQFGDWLKSIKYILYQVLVRLIF